MLSLDLFDSKFEKKLHEGAVDNTIEHLLKPLSLRAAEIRTKIRSGRLDAKQIDQLEKEYEELVQKRLDIILDRRPQTEQQQSQRAPARGLLKGKDLVTPQQRVAGATPAKPGLGAAVKDVAGGIKRWVKGEPDQGPTYEQQEPQQSPRALGVANFQRLVKANMGNVPTVNFEFIRPEENFKLDQRGLDLISDYYDGLANDQAKNYFIYRVLPSGDETLKVLKQLGWTPKQMQYPEQPELPGIPKQGQLPLEEKKKSKDDDLEAGDIKVARELQKLRAQYPAARSDVEAVARAEIDSSERSQQQLAAIRGANEKQDALLKQLVALDQEQGREIDNLDKENNSLEKQLARVQSTNAKLAQTVNQMTGAKKSSRPADKKTTTSIDLIPGAPADVKSKSTAVQEPESEPVSKPATSPAMSAMARQIQGLTKAAPTIRPAPGVSAANEPIQPQAKVSGSDIAEHGGGIGPRQHWQDLMPEETHDATGAKMYQAREKFLVRHNGKDIAFFPDIEQAKAAAQEMQKDLKGFATVHKVMREGWSDKYNPTPYAVYIDGRQWKTFSTDDHARAVADKVRANLKRQGRNQKVTIAPSQEYLKGKITEEELLEGIKDTASATAVIACLLTGGSLTGCATAPQQTSSQQVLKTGQDIGRTVQTAKQITRASVEAEVNQEIRNLARGLGTRPEELNNSNILRIWRKLQGSPPVPPQPQAPEYGPAEPVKRMPQYEGKEIHTRDDFIKERDRLLRMIAQETNPANKQILKSAIRQLENRAENEGWIALQQRMIREDTAALAAEDAILKRIFVRHKDLMMEYGAEKITQAAESVAYNVGDIAHISDEQINQWVGQVEQILGARP